MPVSAILSAATHIFLQSLKGNCYICLSWASAGGQNPFPLPFTFSYAIKSQQIPFVDNNFGRRQKTPRLSGLNHEPKLAVFPPVLCCAKNAPTQRRRLDGEICTERFCSSFPVVLTASDTYQLHVGAQAMRAATFPCAQRRIDVSCCSPCPGCSIRS